MFSQHGKCNFCPTNFQPLSPSWIKWDAGRSVTVHTIFVGVSNPVNNQEEFDSKPRSLQGHVLLGSIPPLQSSRLSLYSHISWVNTQLETTPVYFIWLLIALLGHLPVIIKVQELQEQQKYALWHCGTLDPSTTLSCCYHEVSQAAVGKRACEPQPFS